jgi:uncharacterized protein YhjY with autotransporter beta-barrel domain
MARIDFRSTFSACSLLNSFQLIFLRSCRLLHARLALLLLLFFCLGAPSAFAANITFDYESGVSGFSTKTVTQALSGETLKAVSVSDTMDGSSAVGYGPINGGESLFSGSSYIGETSVTFSLNSGKAFDLTSIAFYDWASTGPMTITLTSSKGTATYNLGKNAIGTFAVSSDGSAANMQGITSFTVTSSTSPFGLAFDDIALQNIGSAPTATTGSASSISATGATLNGTINDNGADTTVTFDYGLTTGYGTNVAATTGGTVTAGSGSTAVAKTIGSLTCNTTYHFRVKGVNSVGTTNGSDQTFTTSKCPQTITFNNPGAQNFGTTPTLTATSTSSLTVAFSSSTTGVCTITAGGALTFVTAGTCTINADQAGDSTYAAATTVPQSFAVNAVVPGAPTIGTATAGDTQASVTFTAPASNGGAAITTYTATANPGGATGTCAGPAACSITVTGLTNGTSYTFSVTATNSAGTGSASAASNSVTPKAAQTITFNNPGAQNFGTTPTLSATSTSGLTVAFSSSTTGVCTITSGGALTFVTAGTCTINADQAGDSTYAAATTVTRSFTVNAVVPGAPTIGTATAGNTQASVTFTAPGSNGGAAITGYTVTSSPGGLTGTGAASPITVTGLTNGTAYTFTVTATNSAGTGSASAASNSVTPKASQTITFNNPGAQNFGTAPTLTATSDSGLTVTFTSSTTGVCTITSGGALTFLTAGTCTINADQAGNGSYLAATTVSRSFAVNAVVPGAPTIGTAAAGDTQATISFTAPASNGGATITGYTVTSNPGGLTGTGAASPIAVSGLTNGVSYTFTVTATNSAGTGSASAASNSITPNPGPSVVSVAVPANGTYGTGQNLDFTVTWDSNATVTGTPRIALTIGSTTVYANYVSSPTATTALFRYTVAAGNNDSDGIAVGALTLNGGTIQNGSGTNATLTLNSVGSTVSVLVNTSAPGAPTIGTATAGDTQASVTFTAPAPNGSAAVTTYTATASPGGATGTCAGPSACTITVNGLTNGTAYTFTVTATNISGSSTASAASNSVTPKGSQTITFNNPGAQNFGTSPTLTATSTSGLTPTFTSSTTGVCSITSGGALTFVTAGTCTVNADQAGNGSYIAATTVSRSFTVNAVVPGAPTIGTATPANQQASVAFTAPASNGGTAITGYTVTSSPGGFTGTGTSSPIIVSGLTNGTAYTFTVRATNSAGTGSASAASTSVTPITTQTITFNNPGAQNFGTSPALTATASSGLTVAFTSSTASVCTITSGGTLTFVTTGTCTINANQAGNGAYTAAPQVTQSFTVNAGVPGVPVIGTVTGGNAQASVPFTAPASNGGSAITGYTVTASPGGVTASGTSSPIIVTGLTNGTAYTFTVKATNTVGSGAASSASNSVTPAGLPGAPTSVNAVAGDTSATITFTAPASNGGSAITTYTATSSPGGLAGSCAGPAACTITVNGLTNGTAYTFAVTATNSVGTGAASSPSNSVTFVAVPTASAATMTTTLNTPVTLDLASSITGTGITGINVTVAAKHGATSVSGTQVTYTPINNYFGTDTFSYVSVSGTGTSAAAVVTVTITGRPDPSKDTNVTSLATAEVETMRSFWRAQLANFQQRMEALHHPVRHDADASDGTPRGFAQNKNAPRIGSANFAQINARSAREAQANNSPPALSNDDGASKLSSAFASAVMGQINAQTANAALLNNPYAPASAGAPQSQSALVTTLVTALMPNGVSLDASDPSASSLNVNLAALNGGKNKPGALPVNENEAWAGGNIRIGSKKTEDGSQKIDYTTKGVSFGMDRRLTDNLTLGIGLGYARDNSTIGTDGTGSTASGSSVAGYGSYQIGSAFVDGLLGFGQVNLDTTRYVASVGDFAYANRSGSQTFASLSTGYEYFKFNALISPYARYDYAANRLNDATENGAGLAALHYGAQTLTSQQLSFGLRGQTQHQANFGLMMPRARVEYQHHIDGGDQATVSYADLLNTQYTLSTPTVNSDALLLGVGSGFMLRRNVKLDLDYQFLHSSMQENSHALFVRLWYQWR